MIFAKDTKIEHVVLLILAVAINSVFLDLCLAYITPRIMSNRIVA